MFRKILLVAMILFGMACMAGEDKKPECREVYFNEVKFCSISFYELLSDTENYDGVNIRLAGYLKYEMGGAVISPDRTSIDGPIIVDNVIQLHVEDGLKEHYVKNDNKMVVVYGTYRADPEEFTIARGLINPVISIDSR